MRRILARIRALFPRVRREPGERTTRNGLAMALSLVIAIVLWFTFSMEEVYTTTVEVPLEIVSLPEGRALQSYPPSAASVSLQGRGENLFALTWTPPRIRLFADGPTVNVAEAVEEAGLPGGVTVLGAQPRTIRLDLEDRIERDLPVRLDGRIRAAQTFDLLSPPTIEPAMVQVSGARSLLNGFTSWPTEPFLADDLSQDLRTSVALSDTLAGLVELSTDFVLVSADIVEFTGGEMTLPVEVVNLPPQIDSVRFEPRRVNAFFDSPVGDALERVQQVGFRAVVDYEDIARDAGTGTVSVGYRLRDGLDARNIRFEPSRVEYFFVRRDTTQAAE